MTHEEMLRLHMLSISSNGVGERDLHALDRGSFLRLLSMAA